MSRVEGQSDGRRRLAEIERRLSALERTKPNQLRLVQVDGEESTTSSSYTLLGTPDEISTVIVPTDGILVLSYTAAWKESVLGAARAAFFIGANQMKSRAGSVQETRTYDFQHYTDMTSTNVTATPGVFHQLTTFGEGLVSPLGAQSLVATGQALAPSVFGTYHQESSEPPAFGTPMCLVEVAAGTYAISVKFKTSSGTVTVKERKLRVWTIGF